MIFEAITRLLDYGVRKNIITVEDTLYVRNRLLDTLCLSEWQACCVHDKKWSKYFRYKTPLW